MGLRVYFSPIVGDGKSTDTAFRPKLSDLGLAAISARIPHNADGSPSFPWALVIARNATWSAVDLDSTLERIFGIDLPDSIDTWAELKAFLQSKTVRDIPAARRRKLQEILEAKGIDTSQVTLETTWWQVLRGIVRHINGGELPSNDGISIS